MKRLDSTPRTNWKSKVEEHGLVFHTLKNGQPYWNESAYYELSAKEVDKLEAVTNELQDMCLKAGQFIIDNNRFAQMGIPAEVVPLIKWAWDAEPPAIYGRFDLAYDGESEPKLLEYNADTPTALLEASVIQWFWKEEVINSSDQFNSIHEKLVAKWTELKNYVTSPLYFTHVADDSLEDFMTVTYLRDTADEAGIESQSLLIGDLGWNGREFVDLDENEIKSIFKLYPWEWLVHEEFGSHLLASYKRMQWIEPIWKMMFSNKGILPILWELFPNHPNLLKSFFTTNVTHGMDHYVMKPLLSREGANIKVISFGVELEHSDGDYGEEGFIVQEFKPIYFDQYHPVVGSWVVDGVSAGIGIRESTAKLITDNLSSFVPHIFS